jgi:Domain of unknown function (DUF1707)/FHA domain
MAGSAADTPATPESVRVSDAERDHAISELRQEFVEGRLSHETFMFRMQTALGARHRGQLTRLFTDLPPRRVRLLARVRGAFRRRGRSATDPAAQWPSWPHGGQSPPALPGLVPFRIPGPGSWGPGAYGEPGAPAPLVFPPGSGTCFTIGRTQECDLRIADLSVSRLHAELARDHDGWLLSDLGSHNGTRVNGWLVREPVPVRAGDVLQFGSATFVIRDPQGPGSPPSGDPGGTGGG